MMMAQVSLDELGPVDYVVVEFRAGASSFTSEDGGRAAAMADSGTIRVIDVMILTKDADTTGRPAGYTGGLPFSRPAAGLPRSAPRGTGRAWVR
jgi:hypothetical protein